MNQNSVIGNNKAQKGWLSRWTRKQWSRHWFVLKNGSLTYYRGPAAELCSFLDGVLDLSLIKHIEVHRDPDRNSSGTTNGNSNQDFAHHHHPIQHYHYLSHLSAQNQQHLFGWAGVPNGIHHTTNTTSTTTTTSTTGHYQQQFTFSLKMWNGECHLFSASSAAERNLWLEWINASANADSLNEDATSTDSSSSSDSSPTSNLSAKSLDIGQPSPAQRRSYDSPLMAAYLRGESVKQVPASSPSERDQKASMVDLVQSAADGRQILICKQVHTQANIGLHLPAPPGRRQHLDETLHHHRQQLPSQFTHQQHEAKDERPETHSEDQNDQDKQASKRRLISVQARAPVPSNPKLITHSGCAKLPFKDTSECEKLRSDSDNQTIPTSPNKQLPVLLRSIDSDNTSQPQDDLAKEEEVKLCLTRSGQGHVSPNMDTGKLPDEPVTPSGAGCLSSSQVNAKQRKRVTFDLSSLASEACYAESHLDSSFENSSASGDSSSQSESSSGSECELDDLDESDNDQEDKLEQVKCPRQIQIEPLIQNNNIELDRGDSLNTNRPILCSDRTRETNEQQHQQLLLAARLDDAQASIKQLEQRLNSSYASYNQLEISYKRLLMDMASSHDQFKLELAQVQARVDELTRQLKSVPFGN